MSATRGSPRPGDAGVAGADRPAGRIATRRGLPSGRAVAGGFFVAVAAVVVFAAFVNAQGRSARRWVVAATALPAGTRLSAADLTTTTLRLGSGPVAEDAFADPAAAVGRTLAVALAPGELVERSELAAPHATPSLRPVPVTVTPADLVDLRQGDLADVLVTFSSSSSGAAARSPAEVVVRGARVLGLTQPSGGLLGSSGDSGDVVTIGVRTLGEVRAIVGAEHAGTVDLVVGERSDGTGPGS